MPQPRLELSVSLVETRAAECARHLRGTCTPESWRILAALAAEVLAIHESAAAGATRVLVVPASALKETKLAAVAEHFPAGKG